MTSQPWILDELHEHPTDEMWLQWSHDLSAMDTVHLSIGNFAQFELQWSHDLSAMDTLLVEGVGAWFTSLASMEP